MPRSDRQPRRRLDPDARRQAIMDAAAHLFATLPYTHVTISAIAAGADASDALVYRYFASKEDLYAHVVRQAIADLQHRQGAALADVPAGTSLRDRVRAATSIYLDHIRDHPAAWAMPLLHPGTEPAAVAGERQRARRDYVEYLRQLLAPSTQARHEYALWGFFGFLDAACLRWVQAGCNEPERWALIDAALGALEGALGDWAA